MSGPQLETSLGRARPARIGSRWPGGHRPAMISILESDDYGPIMESPSPGAMFSANAAG
jgi:hypothetical protein